VRVYRRQSGQPSRFKVIVAPGLVIPLRPNLDCVSLHRGYIERRPSNRSLDAAQRNRGSDGGQADDRGTTVRVYRRQSE
jgi:hypothetical protein